MTTNVASPDMLSPFCARGRLAGRSVRVLVRRRRWCRVHNQTSVVIASTLEDWKGERGTRRRRVNPHLNSTLNQGVRPTSFLSRPRRPMSGAKYSLRIFALPLSKQSVTGITTGTGRGRTVLNTYYHFVTTPPSEADQGTPSLISRVTDRATGMWDDWGKAAPGTWKVGTLRIAPCALRRADPPPRSGCSTTENV